MRSESGQRNALCASLQAAASIFAERSCHAGTENTCFGARFDPASPGCPHQLRGPGNLSIAAPILKDEFRLSTFQLGILFSAFFYTYTALIFCSGWLVDRFNVNFVLGAGFLL
jgi:hypothetical protein